jgi:hypothetical protein
VPKKELDGSQVFGAAVDQGRLCASQGVRPVAALSKPSCLTHESTMRAYWRVERCVEPWSRLGNRLLSGDDPAQLIQAPTASRVVGSVISN